MADSEPATVAVVLDRLAEAALVQNPCTPRARQVLSQALEAVLVAALADADAVLDQAAFQKAADAIRALLDVKPARREAKTVAERLHAAVSAMQLACQPEATVQEDPELLGEFIEEAGEHMEQANRLLLELETHPGDRERLDALFRAFHTTKGLAGFLRQDLIHDVAHASEHVLEAARLGRLPLRDAALELVFQARDTLVGLLQQLKAGLAGDACDAELPCDPRALSQSLCATAKPFLEPSGADPSAAASARPAQVPSGGNGEPISSPEPSSADWAGEIRDLIKVDAERLDKLVNMIGELVIAESMVSQNRDLRRTASAELVRDLSQLDKITRELQEIGMSLRMVPIRPLFQKMARLCRDVAKSQGKLVVLDTQGAETELDKTIVDQLSDPLVHLVRNAIGHGLESASERQALGKPMEGRLSLRAFHRGGNFYIEIEDDGRGIDPARVWRRAEELGLALGEQPSDRECFELLFKPGFSTQTTVTELSGRGVGLDVVKRQVEAMRGQVDVTSTPGAGARFTLRLPLTLAIIDGMVVRVGRERYILPTLSIIKSLRPEPAAVQTVFNRGVGVFVKDRLIPVMRLGQLFEVPNAETDLTRGIVVVVEDEQNLAGLAVDELLGEQQIVMKNLGSQMVRQPGLAGGAILPDGRVGLVLDVAGLVRMAHQERELHPTSELAR